MQQNRNNVKNVEMVPNLDEAVMHTVPVEPTQLVNLSAQFNVSLVSAPSGPKCIRRTDCPAASGMLKSILSYPNFLTHHFMHWPLSKKLH